MLGPLARNSIGAKIREVEAQFRRAQTEGDYPSDEEILKQLDAL